MATNGNTACKCCNRVFYWYLSKEPAQFCTFCQSSNLPFGPEKACTHGIRPVGTYEPFVPETCTCDGCEKNEGWSYKTCHMSGRPEHHKPLKDDTSWLKK